MSADLDFRYQWDKFRRGWLLDILGRARVPRLGFGGVSAARCPVCGRRSVRPDFKAMEAEMRTEGTPWWLFYQVRCSRCDASTTLYAGPDGALLLEAAAARLTSKVET